MYIVIYNSINDNSILELKKCNAYDDTIMKVQLKHTLKIKIKPGLITKEEQPVKKYVSKKYTIVSYHNLLYHKIILQFLIIKEDVRNYDKLKTTSKNK